MKKFLSTVAALGMVAGVASAANALELSVSGHYYVEGYYLSRANGAGFNPYESDYTYQPTNTNLTGDFQDLDSDAYYVHEFKMKPVLKVNDQISMHAEILFADDNVWGNQDDTDNVGNNNGHVDTDKIWMEYMSPIGKWRIGRVPSGGWYGDFVNDTGRADRIMYWPNFIPKPWKVLLFLQKTTEDDAYAQDYDGDLIFDDFSTDEDNDYYEADLEYKSSNLLAAIGLGYRSNETGANTSRDMWRVKGYLDWKIANWFVESEFDVVNQDVDVDNADGWDEDGLAFYLNVGGKFGALTTGMMYFHVSGDDGDGNNDTDNYEQVTRTISGKNFNPLYVITGSHSGMLSEDTYAYNGDMATAGVNAIGWYAVYQVSDKLTINGAIGYAWADETGTWDDVVLEDDAAALTDLDGRDEEYGWEIDLGVSYKLLDNLTYELHFGYVDAGDFWEADPTINSPAGLVAAANAAGITNFENDPENIYLVSHHLTMKF
jgi:hypothetical protein